MKRRTRPSRTSKRVATNAKESADQKEAPGVFAGDNEDFALGGVRQEDSEDGVNSDSSSYTDDDEQEDDSEEDGMDERGDGEEYHSQDDQSGNGDSEEADSEDSDDNEGKPSRAPQKSLQALRSARAPGAHMADRLANKAARRAARLNRMREVAEIKEPITLAHVEDDVSDSSQEEGEGSDGGGQLNRIGNVPLKW